MQLTKKEIKECRKSFAKYFGEEVGLHNLETYKGWRAMRVRYKQLKQEEVEEMLNEMWHYYQNEVDSFKGGQDAD